MLRVYLDQNKWIDLARAAQGHRLGAPFQDVLAVAREAVARGRASFPLDMARYIETHKRANYRSREELASIMRELSQFHALAPSQVVLPCEIDAVLHKHFGVPVLPHTLSPFGVGIEHASGGAISTRDRIKLPPGLKAPPGYLAMVNARASQLMEWKLLAGMDPSEPQADSYAAARAAMTQDRQYADYETDLASRLVEHGYQKGERLTRVMGATDLWDIREPFQEAIGRAGISLQEILDRWTPGQWTVFMKDIPTRDVTMVLRREKHAQGQQRWEPNDLNDIISLSVASVYCDVVVTERQWVSRMSRAHVDQRYDTRLIADVGGLTSILIEAAC